MLTQEDKKTVELLIATLGRAIAEYPSDSKSIARVLTFIIEKEYKSEILMEVAGLFSGIMRIILNKAVRKSSEEETEPVSTGSKFTKGDMKFLGELKIKDED